MTDDDTALPSHDFIGCTTPFHAQQFQNQLAAFPSLHFGYSWVIGVSLYTFSPNRFIRMVSLAYPLLILLVIMATANHYLLDAVGGGLVSVLAYRANTILLNLRPLEEWGFWVCG